MARVFITSEKKCMATQVLPITSNTTSGSKNRYILKQLKPIRFYTQINHDKK